MHALPVDKKTNNQVKVGVFNADCSPFTTYVPWSASVVKS